MKVKHLKSDIINIDIKEALRYLRYKDNNIDEETSRLINESIAMLYDIGEPKYVYKVFDIEHKDNIVSFENQLHIHSKSLSKLFNNCEKSAIFAATIGFEVEKRINYYSKTNLSKSVVFDACSAAYIEALCDYIEYEIESLADNDGYDITYRYSPGYGDVPISHQKDILSILNAQKYIGLSALESFILVPRKSVTAFIGWHK